MAHLPPSSDAGAPWPLKLFSGLLSEYDSRFGSISTWTWTSIVTAA